MGNPFTFDDWGAMCFNAAKNWYLGWYDDSKELFDPKLTDWIGTMVGIADYENNPNNRPVVLKIETGTLTDQLIAFNRAIGINRENDQADDEVTVVETGRNGEQFSQSWLKASLKQGETYKYEDWASTGQALEITVKKIDLSADPAIADISICLGGCSKSVVPSAVPSAYPSSLPSVEPSVYPKDRPSALPSVKSSGYQSDEANYDPSSLPPGVPSSLPSLSPSRQLSFSDGQPSVQPSLGAEPSAIPSVHPSNSPPSGNVALNGRASQKSTYNGGVASRAINNNTDGYLGNGSFTRTRKETGPWWTLQLSKSYKISKVNVFNRQDCCGDRILNFVMTIYRGGSKVYYSSIATPDESGLVKRIYEFMVPDVVGDNVEIKIPGPDKILSLVEVQVMGVAVAVVSLFFANNGCH